VLWTWKERSLRLVAKPRLWCFNLIWDLLDDRRTVRQRVAIHKGCGFPRDSEVTPSNYNNIRTHRSLDKDAPVSRPIQLTGIISSHAILGGLHHRYMRV
jgi:hypothetical protein